MADQADAKPDDSAGSDSAEQQADAEGTYRLNPSEVPNTDEPTESSDWDDESDDDIAVELGLPPDNEDRYTIPRLIILLYDVALFVYLLMNASQLAALQNQPVSVFQLIAVVVLPMLVAMIGIVIFTPLIALWLAGITGFLCSFWGLDGPYCAVLGTVSGLLATLIYFELTSPRWQRGQ